MNRIGFSELFAATALLVGCGPVIQGGWEASGHTGVAAAFDLDLTFKSDKDGVAVFATADKRERAVPICQPRFEETKVRFMIDTAGGTNCATVQKPLTFSGTIGEDVMSGDIHNASGERVGMWRAYRREKK